ncbi:hypothetical protein FRC10_003102 [Ceratobasidium sp. 414]|nr:hypothetical protein FRC10_003102 [Ceratobasidium sp. 414]
MLGGLAHRPTTTTRTRRVRPTTVRPPPHWFTLGTLRTFPTRMRHPPPPAVEERYFMFVAPRYNVPLDEVIADKHLPPLSLRDFEDYLRHVEGTPENLYFHLWVRQYRRVHHAWAESVLPTVPSSSRGTYRSRDLWERLAPCQDRQLKKEFASAKATFFDRHAPMRLGISDELRNEVMHIRNVPPQETQALTDKLPSFPNQPEPSHFDAVLAHVDAELAAACDRFVFLAFRNSGLWHSCLGHLLGVAILAGGMALWCIGVARNKSRAFVVASLPLIWIGVWFMLVSLNGHCLGVYVTGDARQLYPHEFIRPVPPNIVPPPVYSLARPVDPPCPPSHASSRKTSAASGSLLPVTTVPQRTYSGRRKSDGWCEGEGLGRSESGKWKDGRRKMSEGLVRMFGREAGVARPTAESIEMELKLPPARRTKDLPRESFALEVLPPMEGPTPPPVAITAARRGGIAGLEWGPELEAGRFQVSFQPDERPDSPCKFTEENDFGIVVSEAFDEDEPDAYTPAHVPPSESGSEPATPVGPTSEYLVQRRMAMPDMPAHTRTGSDPALEWTAKEAGEGRVWPWPRRLLGPMTAVHSPIVRRAHWVVTVRTAFVALVVTMGMAVGLVV